MSSMKKERSLIKCDASHITGLGALHRRMYEYLKREINYPRWREDYPSEETAARAIEEGAQFALMEDGKIIGAVVLNEDPAGTYEKGSWKRELSEGEYLVIHSFTIDPELSGRGEGRVLADACIGYAKQHGYKAIRLDIVPGNIPAIKLYEGKGFTFAGCEDLERGLPDVTEFMLYELNF